MCFHLPSVHPITVDLNNIKMSFIMLCFVSHFKNMVIFYQVRNLDDTLDI